MVAQEDSVLHTTEENSIQKNRKEINRKYNASEKGKLRSKIYAQSPKGRYSHLKRSLRYDIKEKKWLIVQLEEEL